MKISVMVKPLLLIALIAAAVGLPAGEKQQPNIVLFFVDDMGWSDLGYRNPVFESPNIDALAAESVDYQQAYIPTPTCSPSRATLLTGQHPARLRMVRHIPKDAANGFDKFRRTDQEFNLLKSDPAQFPSRNWVPLEEVTYAEALGDLGYYNLFVGKWHLGHEPYHPIHQGFDRQIGTSNAGAPKSYYPKYFQNSEVLDDEKDRYLTDLLTDETVEFIGDYDRDQPFMISMWYYSVHSPHQGRKDYVEHFEAKGLSGRYANYAAMVKSVDDSVGRVRAALTEKSIERETIIIFLSDQGGYFANPPFHGGKMSDTLYEGGARVPLLINWPGVTEGHVKQDSIVQSTDLFPTLVEIGGGDATQFAKLDGISLLPTLKSAEAWTRPEAIFGYRAYEDLYATVREGDWKLTAYRSGYTKLYNLKDDIGETTDITWRDRDTRLKHSLLVDALVDFELRMGIYEFSGVDDLPLLKSFYAKQRLAKARLTVAQDEELEKMGRTLGREIRDIRIRHDIDLQAIHLRDHETSRLRDEGLTGDALLEGMIVAANFTEKQSNGFRAIVKRQAKFQADVHALLTPAQRKLIGRN
jgi:arylsulfatase A-like enzyme